MKKRLLSLLLALTLSLGLAVPAFAAGPAFTDVPASYWAYGEIESMAAREVVNGFTDGSFQPARDVTNAQFAKMAASLLFREELAKYTDAAYWWQPFADALLEAGVMDNTAAKSFYIRAMYNWDKAVMESPISRYDMAQVMYNILKVKGVAMPGEAELQAARDKIADYAVVPSDYQEAVAAMYALGCLQGKDSAGNFRGDTAMNRAQACVVLVRLLDQLDAAQPDPGPSASPSPAPSASPEPSASPSPEPSASPEPTPSPTPAPSQNVQRKEASMNVGEVLRVSFPGAPVGHQIKAESADPAVAKVGTENEILAVKAGQTEVTVVLTAGQLTQTVVFKITVEEPQSEGPIQTTDPIQAENQIGADGKPTLTNGKAITEENVQELILALRSAYPEGMGWTNANFYISQALYRGGYGCEGFALICSDTAFGSLPLTATHSDFSKIRAGDILRVNNDTHTVVVLEKREDSVIVAEGNFNSSIHWFREITRQELEAGNYNVRTRYPE